MTLKVWMRLRWTDERLAWNASEWGGVTQLHVMGASMPAGAEITEIWLPDVQPYNAFTGIHNTLDPSMAVVQSSGSVYFSRPGMLDVMCKFSGLAAFPYDVLKCGIEFGGWGLSGGYQGLELMEGGYSFSSQEATAGSSYQEYSIAAVECSVDNFFYEESPNEPWPVIKYSVTLNHADYYYTLFFVFPGMLITSLSFAVFYIEPEACDALAYGVTVVLANEISKLALVGSIPVCGESLWTELFSLTNTVFCVVALFESVLQVIVSNNTTASFLPGWFWFLLSPIVLMIKGFRPMLRRKCCDKAGGVSEDTGGRVLRRRASASEKPKAPSTSTNVNKFHSVASLLTRQLQAAKAADAPDATAAAPRLAPIGGNGAGLALDDIRKLVFFEYLFFMMDENSDGILMVEYCKERISFLALEHSESDIDTVLKAADKDNSGDLTRLEFCELCVQCLSSYPIELLQAANENFVLASSQEHRRNSAYWRAVGSRMDWYCGIVIPSTYIIILAVLFNLTMTDEYTEPNTTMYAGIGPTSLRGLFKYQVGPVIGTLRALAPILVGLALLLASVTYGYAKREKNRRLRINAKSPGQVVDDGRPHGGSTKSLGPSLFGAPPVAPFHSHTRVSPPIS